MAHPNAEKNACKASSPRRSMQGNRDAENSMVGLLFDWPQTTTKAWIWTVSAPIALVSTQKIFLNQDYHHLIYHLLSMHLVVLLAFRILLWATREQTASSLPAAWGANGFGSSPRIWLLRGLSAVSQAIALPLLFKAIALAPTILSALLISVIAEQTLRQLSTIEIPRSAKQALSVARLALAAIAVVAMSHGQHSTGYQGLLYLVGAAIFSVVADVAESGAESKSDDNEEEETQEGVQTRRFSTSAVITALVVCALLAWYDNTTSLFVSSISGTDSRMLMISAIATAMSLEMAGSLITFGNRSRVDPSAGDSRMTWSWHPLVQLTVGGVTAAVSTVVGSTNYTNWLHVVVFVVGIMSLVDLNMDRSVGSLQLSSLQSRYAQMRSIRVKHPSLTIIQEDDDSTLSETWERRHSGLADVSRLIKLAAPFVVVLLAWSCFLAGSLYNDPWGYPRINSPTNPSLDLAYIPQAEIDIVISHYKEPLTLVQSLMAMFESVETVGPRKPRFIIYTKDEAADIAHIQNVTGAYHVEQLPNVGREGGTYIYHIDENWDQLAKHTIFTQAEMWDIPKVKAALETVFGPEVGMLGLGFEGDVVANCTTPQDKWEWKEIPHIMQDMYGSVYKDRTCEPYLMGFKGQFAASARRIRGVDRSVFGNIRSALFDGDSWMHKGEYPEWHKAVDRTSDTLNAPHYGFTLERSWCTMMQCQDPDVGFHCPLQKFKSSKLVGDCMCWDDRAVTARPNNQTCRTEQKINLIDLN